MISKVKRYRYASFKASIVQLFIRLFVPLFKRYVNENKRSNFSIFLRTRRIPLELTLHSHPSIIVVKSTFFIVVSSNCILIHERSMFFHDNSRWFRCERWNAFASILLQRHVIENVKTFVQKRTTVAAYDFVLFRFAITIAWSGYIIRVWGKYVNSNFICFLLNSYTFPSSWILLNERT